MSLSDENFKLSPELELERIVSMQEAQRISSLSPDSWKRNHPDKIVELSSRRLGVRLRDALMLGGTTAARAHRGNR